MQHVASKIDDAILVRRATRDDVDALTLLAREAFCDAYSATEDAGEIEDYVTSHFTPAIFAAILDDSSSTLLVADVGGHLIGYAQVSLTEPPPCVTGPAPIELVRLYLLQATIGKGYGAAMMQAVHEEARRRQCRTLWLVVYDRNQRARDFYRRGGFVDVGIKDFLFGGRYYPDPVMATAVRGA